MKAQLDFKNKTIVIQEDVPVGKLIKYLEEYLPDSHEWTLKQNPENLVTYTPITKPVHIAPNWWQNPHREWPFEPLRMESKGSDARGNLLATDGTNEITWTNFEVASTNTSLSNQVNAIGSETSHVFNVIMK
jgi:hypothetical protein